MRVRQVRTIQAARALPWGIQELLKYLRESGALQSRVAAQFPQAIVAEFSALTT
jgi:hypothetical protein